MSVESLREVIIKNGNIPSHIAIIMDGNGRWAKEKMLPRFAGHGEGINLQRVMHARQVVQHHLV